MRTWTAPDLSDAEYIALLKVFPSFVVQNPLPRFPVASSEIQLGDPERGDLQQQSIRIGTGTMWIGGRVRSAGYHGNWWTRFKLWLRTLFC